MATERKPLCQKAMSLLSRRWQDTGGPFLAGPDDEVPGDMAWHTRNALSTISGGHGDVKLKMRCMIACVGSCS